MKGLKILYLSLHTILEYNELRLFTDSGADVFSVGSSYSNPQSGGEGKRPPLKNMKFHEDLYRLGNDKKNLPNELIEWADVIILMHIDSETKWIRGNWERMKHKKVIYRSIGQSSPNIERFLKPYRDQGLKVVRYSPNEKNIEDYCGEDAMIRFHQYGDEWPEWKGRRPRVMACVQSFKSRDMGFTRDWVGYRLWKKSTAGIERIVYGIGNHNMEEWAGEQDFEGIKKAFSEEGCAFVFGTHPAPYTLSIQEMACVGMPMAVAGEGIRWLNGADPNWSRNQWEVPEMFKGACLVAENVEDMTVNIRRLIADHEFAKDLGQKAKQRARELFDVSVIRPQWESFLNSL